MRGGGDGLPLLRGITAQTLAGVAAEEQVIVFAERVWCLRQLARTLCERHGVEAHVADGQIKPHEFEALKHRFTSGEFPVLCLSGSARRATTSKTPRSSCTSICRGCRRALSILLLGLFDSVRVSSRLPSRGSRTPFTPLIPVRPVRHRCPPPAAPSPLP